MLMRCQNCDYRLWNIKGRHCPECSNTFTPSDYHFKPDAVEFCCPHCMHVYLGTPPHGHPDPADFNCTNCNQHIHMNDMLLRPVDPREEAFIVSLPNPWTLTTKSNRLANWLLTIQQSALSPQKLIDGTPTKGGSLDALAFASSIILVICVVGLELPFLVISIVEVLNGSLESFFMNLLFASGMLIGSFILLLLQSAVVHALLKCTGGTQQDLGCTFKTLAYTMGPLLGLALPCCNIVLFIPLMFWYYVGSSIALVRMQQVHPVRAMLSLLLLPMVIIALYFRFYLFS